jgi:rRNA processing protein Krr1/Pno1
VGGGNFLLGIYFSKEGVYSKKVPKKANQLKTISELTPKQRKFVDIYVSNYGEISKVEAAKQAGFTSTNGIMKKECLKNLRKRRRTNFYRINITTE